MKIKIFFFFTMISLPGFAQIYIGANTPVYVKNQVLYVTQNINLAANSNLYLRNNSQLVQGTTGTSTNTGTGIVSVYQEGTSDNFEYNYWCSPVGSPTLTAGNTNFGITLLNRPTSSTAVVPATILPMSNYNGTANPLAIAPYWIYKLTNANNYSQWVQVGSATTIAAGEGFTMKGTSGPDTTDPEATGAVNNPGAPLTAQRYDFRGKPNDGNIAVTVGSGNAATLTGNPYPSAIDLNAFLMDPTNSACTRIAYFWEQDKSANSHYLSAYKGGYGTYSPGTLGSNGVYVAATFNSYKADGSLNTTGTSSGLVIQRKYSPIGQGFLINGASNGTVTFKNAHRVFYKEGSPLSQFAKSSPNKTDAENKEEDVTVISHFKLNTIINNEFTRQLALAFMPEATDGVDPGIDALNMDQTLPNDASFWLENGNYVIQGVNFELTKKIPLAVKATTNTTLKFYIPEVINFDPSQKIYMYDELDASYHDIKTGTYQVTIAPGVYTERFKIAFTNITLGLSDEVKTNFFVSQDNTNKILNALNPDNIVFKSFVLYDILGRAVLTKNNLEVEQNYTFSTSGLSSGIYIATFVTADNEKIAQKVVISNSGKQ
ncbi:T9SS C-terminal target domain-containing protein [Flavobacterium circumlabens]|uniref:Secreted protein (Por secretion system target) n=1 Tax=Flavobacterium circumlabens TaxID=2133765 RepID=A0A4Y7UFN8_9FLAO|nr:T9SS type A sorting domain-containing protein [Flavobacterium circumlabens]TCN60040.1 putative secreted protein (Por secretion system target) [Flavobacterium circumlabens]TEB45275.1 T9SS C-terminal target domain-containing protein [Flavobacterium circumlabens]